MGHCEKCDSKHVGHVQVLVSPADSRTHAEQTAGQASPELATGSRASQEDAAEEHAAAPGAASLCEEVNASC